MKLLRGMVPLMRLGGIVCYMLLGAGLFHSPSVASNGILC